MRFRRHHNLQPRCSRAFARGIRPRTNHVAPQSRLIRPRALGPSGALLRAGPSRLAFRGQQLRLYFKSPRVARETAVSTDHPVARNDEGRTIVGAGTCHSTHRCRAADVRRHLPVRARLTLRDPSERLPDTSLKRRATHIERKVRNPISERERTQCSEHIGHGVLIVHQFGQGELGTDFSPKFVRIGADANRTHAVGRCDGNDDADGSRCGRPQQRHATRPRRVDSGWHTELAARLFVEGANRAVAGLDHGLGHRRRLTQMCTRRIGTQRASVRSRRSADRLEVTLDLARGARDETRQGIKRDGPAGSLHCATTCDKTLCRLHVRRLCAHLPAGTPECDTAPDSLSTTPATFSDSRCLAELHCRECAFLAA